MANPTFAGELDRLARYTDERRHAARFGFVDLSAVLLVVSEQLHGLAAAASNGETGDFDQEEGVR